ncbi:MAG TPA: chlorite dismutase family protein [Anaerolineaceae bacterium]
MTDKSINHFMLLRFTGAYWEVSSSAQQELFPSLALDLEKKGLCANFYQTQGLKSGTDFLIWSAAPAASPQDEANFFGHLGSAVSRRRQLIEPVESLWGYTRPSVYARGQSSQEIDPFASQRQTYLVLYPFVKTIQWYLLGKDTRQGMMNEHIRIGRQYPQIQQLLLYSFGVQDQEFVVVYETEELYRFSELVNELRGSDVREYTQRDTPVYTGIWKSPQAMADLFAGEGQA